MLRDPAESTSSRRTTLLPPPPSNPHVLQACWEPVWCDHLGEEDLESVPPSSAPTFWQGAPATEWDALRPDDIHYRTIASELKLHR